MNEETRVQKMKSGQSEMMIFENDQFGTVRTISKNGEPWFVAADVCKALGLTQVTRAMAKLDNDEGGLLKVPHPQNPSSMLEMNCVNEPGLYTLVLSSRKPEAKLFKRWITHDVIPSIRKHGAYMTRSVLDQLMDEPNGIVLLAQQLLAEREEKLAVQSKLEVAQPKADYYDAFVSEDSTTSIRNTAKELGVPQNIFVSALVASGYLYRDRRGILLPYARFAESGSGLFRVRDVYRPNGEVFQWTLITPKGKDYFRKKLSS